MFAGWSHYGRVFWTFFVNAFIRELMFRGHFFITFLTRTFWFSVQIMLFDLIYRQVPRINDWTRSEYFVFIATGMLINALIEALFLPNCANFGELIRTGNLDFVLLKPIDPQFLVSFEKMDLSMFSQVALALVLLISSLRSLDRPIAVSHIVLYAALVLAAVAFFYSLMIGLSGLSVFFGRNQGLLDFWFYITIFARYPSSIYSGSPWADLFRFAFSYVLPILLVVTVPARVIAGKLLEPSWLHVLMLATAGGSLLVSRLAFRTALRYYRSASS